VVGDFTIATFAGREGQSFRVRDPGGEIILELFEVTDYRRYVEGVPEPPRRTPFALLFLGPHEPSLPDCIHRFEHEELGVFEVYVSQKQPGGKGRCYEVVFT